LAAAEPASSPTPQAEREKLVEAVGLRAGYGRRQVLFDVDLHVGRGEIVAMFGHNGAGKTTTLKSIYGQVRPTGGTVRFAGEGITRSSCARNVKRGMAYVAAEHFVFGELSVLDNLRLGAHLEPSRAARQERLRRVCDIFPILEERKGQAAGTMSGGQQRMLSMGIALMSKPRLLLLDEPSLGLSPTLVEQVMAVVGKLAREDELSVLLVEQNVVNTLPVIDRAYFMRSGRIILDETAEQLRERESYWDLF
jgi:branched-chain amino acid transport system ATP-binding protein